MVRMLCLLAVLAACGSERTPVTTKVATLGYSHPPLVVVVGRGPKDLVEPWVVGMRSAKDLRVVGEVMKPDSSDDAQTTCRDARESMQGAPVEEIVVIDVVQSNQPINDCEVYRGNGPCERSRIVAQSVRVNTTVTAYRASTCARMRATSLPLAIGTSQEGKTSWYDEPSIDVSASRVSTSGGHAISDDAITGNATPGDGTSAHATIEATSADETIDATSGGAIPADGSTDGASTDAAVDDPQIIEARAVALTRLGDFALRVSWNLFPRDSSIQLVEGDKILIAGPLKLGDYFLKVPSSTELQPGVHVVSHTTNSATLQVDDGIKPEPGDELHAVTDMMTVAGFTMVSGGIATANGKTRVIAGAGLAARWSWDHLPMMFEMQFGGDLIPGLDSKHVCVSGAVGLRWPYWISPVAFIELGAGGIYQGDHGARAVAGHAGVGVGLEVRRSRWFAFADARLRAFALGDWTDSDDQPLDVTYPDNTWQTKTGQLGIGFNY